MFLTCDALASFKNIRHGFFTRNGGQSTGLYESLNCGYGSGDAIETVAENRTYVAKALFLQPDSLCTAFQIHSANVITVDKPWNWKESPQADALVTATPGIGLGILTADCLPILFADPVNQIIGAAHAGWKGAFSGVIESTLRAMQEKGAELTKIIAAIGPAITQPSYEVGSEFYERFIEADSLNSQYFIASDKPEHFRFDLKGYASQRLKNAGLQAINILSEDTCSQENDFFSFRRATLRKEPVYGRQISVIALA